MSDRVRPATLAYCLQESLYLNVTNRCPTACVFCVKRRWRWEFRGWDLKLPAEEPSLEDIRQATLLAVEAQRPRELVFCGYGESTYRLPVILEMALMARRRWPSVRLRLNTVGLGNLICGRDVVPELRDHLDAVSVSLNTADPQQWLKLHAPMRPFRREGFAQIIGFIESCVQAGLETTVTAVDQPGVELEAVAELAASLGARFRVRPELGPLQPRY